MASSFSQISSGSWCWRWRPAAACKHVVVGLEDSGALVCGIASGDPGWLCAVRGRFSTKKHAPAQQSATRGRVAPVSFRPCAHQRRTRDARGAVGAGTGTVCFGFKGGIGTSSRRAGGYTLGALVQTNYGGQLRIAGVPVGELLKQNADATAGGSVIVIVATDAPLEHRNLHRLGVRAMAGLARTGSAFSNGSGDYVIAFSTARQGRPLSNDAMSPLFLAAMEATEEAVYNSLFRSVTTTGNGRTVEALPLERTLEILRRHGALARR